MPRYYTAGANALAADDVMVGGGTPTHAPVNNILEWPTTAGDQYIWRTWQTGDSTTATANDLALTNGIWVDWNRADAATIDAANITVGANSTDTHAVDTTTAWGTWNVQWTTGTVDITWDAWQDGRIILHQGGTGVDFRELQRQKDALKTESWKAWQSVQVLIAACSHQRKIVPFDRELHRVGMVLPRGEDCRVCRDCEQYVFEACGNIEACYACQQREAVRQDADARELEQSEIRDRAKVLLASHLTPEQRASLEANDWFMVDGPSGRHYRISVGNHGNIVTLTDEGKVAESHCSFANMRGLPYEDGMLAQMLSLRYDEETYRKRANISQRPAA